MYLPAETRYENIRYNRVGRSGLKLPAVSLGLWHNFGGVDSLENGRAMLRRALSWASPTSTWRTITALRPVRQRRTLGACWRRIFAPTVMS